MFDHLGRLAQPNALDNPGFRTISKLIDKSKTWVKLSGAYQDSKVGAPSYSDTCDAHLSGEAARKIGRWECVRAPAR